MTDAEKIAKVKTLAWNNIKFNRNIKFVCPAYGGGVYPVNFYKTEDDLPVKASIANYKASDTFNDLKVSIQDYTSKETSSFYEVYASDFMAFVEDGAITVEGWNDSGSTTPATSKSSKNGIVKCIAIGSLAIGVILLAKKLMN